MSRYIDADALIKYMDENEIELRDDPFDGCFDGLKEVIQRFPTVDAVQVVRCRYCRWACLAPQRQTATCMKKRLPSTHDYDFFCADGERKEQEDAKK